MIAALLAVMQRKRDGKPMPRRSIYGQMLCCFPLELNAELDPGRTLAVNLLSEMVLAWRSEST